MRIGIDIRDLKTATTGQKTYLEELCNAFVQFSGPDHQFFFLDTIVPSFKGSSKMTKLLEQVSLHFWKQFVLPVKAAIKRCDILLCTDYFVPYAHLGFKTVAVFHDAFFFENKEHYHPLFIWLFRHIALPSAARCSYIIVPSDYAKKQIHRYYKELPVDRLVTIYEGPKTLSKEYEPVNHATILSKLRIQEKKYLLHVGVMNKRKNIPFLINAYKQLLENGNDYKLVLAGSLNTSQYIDDSAKILTTITQNNLQHQVILTGYLSDEELAVVYQHAFLYVFPSLNEGFGLPIVEAFAYGVPVIVSNNTCLPEIGADAVLTFDPFDETDLVAKMQSVIENAGLRKSLQQKGKERLQDFSWKKTATEMLALFSKPSGK
jgi:glycosyltransferase involved in cell wall biosynthesis